MASSSLVAGTNWKKKLNHPAARADQSFFAWAGNDAALLDLPDTSSADIKLHFEDYGGGAAPDSEDGGPLYQFDLEYDYNRFDEDGVLRKDNLCPLSFPPIILIIF